MHMLSYNQHPEKAGVPPIGRTLVMVFTLYSCFKAIHVIELTGAWQVVALISAVLGVISSVLILAFIWLRYYAERNPGEAFMAMMGLVRQSATFSCRCGVRELYVDTDQAKAARDEHVAWCPVAQSPKGGS